MGFPFRSTLNRIFCFQCAKTIKITMDEKYGQMGAWQVSSSFKKGHKTVQFSGGGRGELWGGHDLRH